MRTHDLSRPAALFLAGLCALGPLTASAQTPPSGGTGGMGGSGAKFPPADAFTIQYWLLNEKGDFLRPLTEKYFNQFLNRARCQCGQQVGVIIRLKKTMAAYDTGQQLQSFVGSQCSMAETSLAGQFRRCAQFSAELVPTYQMGITTTFHPIWLGFGVNPDTPSRLPSEATTAGKCESNVTGEAGVWMCAPNMNNTQNCQADEFFIQGSQNINLPSKTGGLKYDFQPPLLKIDNFKAEPGDGAVVLSWQAGSGDVNGFRVLCEEAATGQPVPGLSKTAPDPYAIPNGQFFYTKDNLCPDGPFSTFNSGEDNPLGTTSDGDDTGTDTDTGGTDTLGDTGGDTGGTVENTECGNEIIEAGEECDDGEANADDGACSTDCKRSSCGDGRVEAGVEECDDGNDEDGDACTNACKMATCGDGSLWVGMELCDMGDLNVSDGESPCNAVCQTVDCGLLGTCPQCGNGNETDDLGVPEEDRCDQGALNSNHAFCKSDCSRNECGDGFVLSDPPDGVLPEECDDGENGDNTDACTEGCLRAYCGDGFVWDGVEQCDDGNDVDTDECTNTCRLPACGDSIVQAGEDCDLGINNSDTSSCSPDCKFTASAGMLSLDWRYVCSDHIPFSTKSYRIRGLENGKEYNFMLVPYDLIGNPAPVATIARGIPVETYDLWEQCEADGGICGASGYCNVSDDSSGGLALFTALAAFGIGGLGVANRRRNRA
ncbi:Myxococcus cysteine-rich repeat-containing protein [Nannocystis exedens]|uniref:Myxococcus cysteine-rich repeat-containing protein n=1 Tax=Nannocystis exedens TaxID=54 RepID=A0A1I2BM89_9BACT|nr:DUF4215 domain-containing protein [Nannocystis exedens]PCC67940.1 hypothetical protein NAEX_00948 [Nannocystis exedens]SFE56350.1 Myxococcus cysteine-rich repeat-containing protein [Nannocystis exedens]